MQSSVFFNFLFLLIYRHRSKHLAIFLITLLVVMLFSVVMLVANSVEREMGASLEAQPDFVVQKMHGGKMTDTPLEWIYELSSIPGVSAAVPRVYGSYFVAPNSTYFTLVGIDLFDRQISDSLEALVEGLDAKSFLEKERMIVGEGIEKFLESHHFTNSYTFRAPDYQQVSVELYRTFPTESSMVSNDMAVMPVELARTILGIDEEHSTDIAVYVPNELEHESVKRKIIMLHGNLRLIEKVSLQRAYDALFNYKGGLFLLLYLVVLITFVLVLYQRYSMISSSDKKEIGILRSLGWSIGAVIRLKVMESLTVGLFAFLSGFLLAYGYVFGLDAPLLAELFMGYGNLPMEIAFNPVVDFGLFSLLFLFFMLPFVAAVLVPVWRIAITDPVEAMK